MTPSSFGNITRIVALMLVFACPQQNFAKASERILHASQPIADGVPQVAVARLKGLLAEKISDEDRRTATLRLGEALVGAGEYEAAIREITSPIVRDQNDARFFHAQALAGMHRWGEALPLYQAVAKEGGSRFQTEAQFGTGEALRGLGRIDEAIDVFRILFSDQRWRTRAHSRTAELLLRKGDAEGARQTLDAVEAKTATERQERRFIRGCIQLQLGNYRRATRLFGSASRIQQGGVRSVLVAALLGTGETHLLAGTPEAGGDFLEDFIGRNPTDPDLPVIFAKLDQLYASERKQSRHDLGRWSRDRAQPRQALALWYLARAELRLQRRDNALRAFGRLRDEHPQLVALAPGLIEYAELLIAESRYDDALGALDSARALRPSEAVLEMIGLVTGKAHYCAARFDAAAQTFVRVGNQGRQEDQTATYNASLAWLSAGDIAQAATARKALEQAGVDEATRGDLALAEALLQARHGDKRAMESLQNFVRNFPNHSRVSESWVALAELAFQQKPPRIEEARQHLRRAAESQPTPTGRERADYLSIWIEDAGGAPNENQVIELANRFLHEYPRSSVAADVRLKLAESYFRRQDFASAQTQFSLLVRQDPNAPIAEKALFFAAQSARHLMGADSIDDALKLYDEVVKKNAELKWAARNEQASIERKLGKINDAVILYDEVLKGDAKPAEKREALCGKADIFYDLGASDPQNYRRAIELYDQLAAESETASHWRNQALFKKGMCLEKLVAPNEALATFYEIVEDGSRPDRRREFFWFYKAGFNAARLLEEQQNWRPAAAIYEKLAFAGGARSEEAKSRLNRLRLEHFLWDE